MAWVAAEALVKIDVKCPAVPVVANVVAALITDRAEIRPRLVGVIGLVRWVIVPAP